MRGNDDEKVLILEFEDPSRNFANGFEAGRIWEVIKSGETIHNLPCSKDNRNMLRNMCEMFQLNYTIEPIDEIWINLNIFDRMIDNLH